MSDLSKERLFPVVRIKGFFKEMIFELDLKEWMGRISGGWDDRGGFPAEQRLGSNKTQGEFRAQQVAESKLRSGTGRQVYSVFRRVLEPQEM